MQGVSELFPVSSLGHAVLVPRWVGGSWAAEPRAADPLGGRTGVRARLRPAGGPAVHARRRLGGLDADLRPGTRHLAVWHRHGQWDAARAVPRGCGALLVPLGHTGDLRGR